ncbi:AfsA-related hotdog domain-containing protein [Streptomyces sp. 4N509B]|uniref:AfsA-related hotdog domain-containing protein n=1 Tax=Streptomyces sp. 4N509B TaxID=3457413 RepID=UPI003FD21511
MISHLTVVADRFAGFAQLEKVLTVSGLAARINGGFYDEGFDDVLLHEGQGVGAFERAHLQAAIDRRKLTDRMRFTDEAMVPVGRDVVHKHSADNVVLAGLRRVRDHEFAADLRVHGDNELLLDHQTGEHVQGMVLVEAARQFFLGVFEVGYRDRWPLDSFYIVWNSVRLTFQSFLFPIPAEVRGVVREISVDRPDRQLEFELEIRILQNGKLVTSGEVGFSGFPLSKIATIERRKAERALTGMLATHG